MRKIVKGYKNLVRDTASGGIINTDSVKLAEVQRCKAAIRHKEQRLSELERVVQELQGQVRQLLQRGYGK